MATIPGPSIAPLGRLDAPAWVIGFALGGFFDGILLHQILQWHHLLSLVPGAGGLPDQVLYDGLFHALMYVVAVIGLVLLARARSALAGPAAGRRLLAGLLLGFGLWNLVDIVGAHWLLGIHRVRLTGGDPLVWDLIWLAAFGLVPMLAGWALRRGGGGDGGPGGRVAAAGLVLVLAVAAPWAAMPPPDAGNAVVLFRPGISDGEAVDAILAAGGRILWRSGKVWAVAWPDEARPARLYRGGAMLVSTSLVGAGCLAWSRVQAPGRP